MSFQPTAHVWNRPSWRQEFSVTGAVPAAVHPLGRVVKVVQASGWEWGYMTFEVSFNPQPSNLTYVKRTYMYSSQPDDSIIELRGTPNCPISHMRKQRSKAGDQTSVQPASSNAEIWRQDPVLRYFFHTKERQPPPLSKKRKAPQVAF